MLDCLFLESDQAVEHMRVSRLFKLLLVFADDSDVSVLHTTLMMLFAKLPLQTK